MSALRSAVGLALLVVSLLASSAFAAGPVRPNPAASARPASLPPVEGYWDDRFDMTVEERWFSANGSYIINDAVIFNGELYVAGRFRDISHSPMTYALDTIARWDGHKWTNLAKWRSNASQGAVINALEVHEANLYVTGLFTQVGSVPAASIARWDGANWHAVGSGLDEQYDYGHALASWKGNLYVAGSFSSAGGVAVNNIARWDGASWHAVGAGLTSETNSSAVGLALKATPFGLYAGGEFDHSGAKEMRALARWDGARWSAVIPGLTGGALSLDWHDGHLYAGGRFALASEPEQIHNILSWDGVQAQLMSAGPNPQTMVLMVRSVDGELYAGVKNGLYRLNSGAWQPFGPPLDQDVMLPSPLIGMDIIAYNGRLHLFGAMEPAATNSVAKYALVLDGNRWVSMGQGAWANGGSGPSNSFMVSGVALIGDDFYIASSSISGAGQYMGNVARWNGAGWASAGIGPVIGLATINLTALAAAGSTLYAAGYEYDHSLGRNRYFIARRDGGAWTTLTNEFNDRVDALAWSDGVLYAGGRFTAVGATPARGVARWNGTAWSALGDSQLYFVRALAVNGGTVYAAGSTSANSSAPNAIARWNSGAWSTIASASVFALAISPAGDLYAGGDFTAIGGIAANSIARWSNGAWAPLGAGVTGSEFGPIVQALAFAPDGALYAGGRFKQAGSVTASNIARYDGQWSALGDGLTGIRMGGLVNYLAVNAQGVYAAGEIYTADGRVSESVAIWRPGAAPQAVADAVAIERGQVIEVAVLANDTDADQDALRIASVTAPSQGAIQVIGGIVRYTPKAGYVGTDSFGYTISDGRGGVATSMVTVNISAPLTSIFVPLISK